MFYRKSIFLIVILLSILTQHGFSQFKQIGGIVNIYTSIDTIYSFNDNNVDSLVVGSVAGFNVGDTVMVYCVQGAKIATDSTIWGDNVGRDAGEPRNTGKYAFLIINEIIGAPRNLVVLNATVRPEIKPMGNGEVAQLIRVPSYRWAEVKPTGLTAQEWNGSTGGVVALFVHQTLRLNGPINVSDMGFTGAKGSEDSFYGGDCSSVDTDLYDSTFYHISNIRAGKKGEGTTDTRFEHMRGKASNINGGGGGNALFSGGGGGSNLTAGGKGGDESGQCTPGVEAPGGRGGFDLGRPGDAYYLNKDEDIVILNRYDRIFLGGGGGAGTRTSLRNTTNGGDGGGLVVIVADTIEGNNNWIRANGASVTAVATGAGGGGGGGGCIVLDVSGYRTSLNLSAVGGNGGDTNHPIDTTGPGGGGGGGIYWMAGSGNPLVNPLISTNGASGEHLSFAVKYGAGDGGLPDKKYGLEAPLRGFLFNSVPTEFRVCSDTKPDPIYASKPKGGDGTYAYQWVDSTSAHTWQQAPGSDYDKQNYTFPGTLSDTTWFRRIVTSGLLPADTSFRIAFYVHQAITNNTIAAPDTVCSGDVPQMFSPSATIGGGIGIYQYNWQKDEETGFYTDADGPGPINQATYQAPGLTTTTHFARIVNSGACADTSSALTVKVWEQLTGNDITPPDTICYNTIPDLIGGPVPGEGDQSDIRYKWETTTDTTGAWTLIPAEESQSFQSLALTGTSYFRRVVLSGSDDACIDYSEPVEILNIPLITGNSISQTQTVCTGDQPDLLQGSDPGGGYLGQYSYQWQSRTLSTSWVPAGGINDIKTGYDPGIMDGDSTFFRRVVGSGGVAMNVCLNSSNEDTIHVLPSITNNLITTVDSVNCQWDLLSDITQNISGGATPGGGATQGGNDPTRTYQWEVATGTDTPGTWQPVAGANAINYEDNPQLDTDDDRWYRRIVFSGPDGVCKDYSNQQSILVHTQITTNSIEPFDSVCFADTKLLPGSTPSGESETNAVYTWRDLNSGLDIPDSDQREFESGPYNGLESVQYERIVNIGACTDTSNTMEITVMQLPGGTLTGNFPRACEQEIQLNVDLNIDNLDIYIIPWELKLYDGVNTELIGPYFMTADGQIDITLDTDEDSTQFDYHIEEIIYRSATGRYECVAPPENLSGNVPIKVFRKPEPEILVDGSDPRDSVKVCNTTVELTVNADNGTGMWTSNPTGSVFFSPDPTAEDIFASIPNNHNEFGKYVLTFRSVAGDCYGEDAIDVHFFEQPAQAYAGEDTMIFLKNSVRLKADPPTAGLGTWELISGSGSIQDEHAPNTLAYELGLGEENRFRWTVVNGEDEGTCTTSDDFVIVIRNEVKRYNGFSPKNGDMDNEYFIMQGLKYADRYTISFFNSLGNTVKVITEKDVEEMEIDESLIPGGLREDEIVVWDGRAKNGNLVPSGTYYYVLEFIMNQRDPVSGTITRTDSYDFKDYVVVIRE